ncbi:hypothetical protein MMC14_001115 [Varicellaria rhodocarpa]|nr:hypothetical protein [Varicellaria rhodocarpa]
MSLPDDPKERLKLAKEWLLEHPSEKIVAACKIFNIKPPTLYASKRRPPPHGPKGGQNAILSARQTTALLKFMNDMHEEGIPTTKRMIFGAVECLRKAEDKDPPSWRWLNSFLQSHPDLLKNVQTIENGKKTADKQARELEDLKEKKERAWSKAIKAERNELHARGVIARKAERARMKEVKALRKAKKEVPAQLLIPVIDPRKEAGVNDQRQVRQDEGERGDQESSLTQFAENGSEDSLEEESDDVDSDDNIINSL